MQSATNIIECHTIAGRQFIIEFCPSQFFDQYRVTCDGSIYADRLTLDEAYECLRAARVFAGMAMAGEVVEQRHGEGGY